MAALAARPGSDRSWIDAAVEETVARISTGRPPRRVWASKGRPVRHARGPALWLAAVRGKLQFSDGTGGAELEARVVRWPWGGRRRFSFHRRLGRFNEMTGDLTLDDRSVIPVKVRGPCLQEIDTPAEV